MICLRCGWKPAGADQSPSQCPVCSRLLGYAAEGSGYLPQLLQLQRELRQGLLSEAEGEEPLMRLDEALGEMLDQLEEVARQVSAFGLDEVQNSTVQGFLQPALENLALFRATAAELALDGDWSEAQWDELKLRQSRLLQSNQGLLFLLARLQQAPGA